MEPEIQDLQRFLNKMGAKVEGAGSNIIKITGVKKLKDVSYNIMPDRIEAGTLLCMTAATSGKLELNNVIHKPDQPYDLNLNVPFLKNLSDNPHQ